MDVESLDDGRGVGRAIQQIVVVVVGLKHIQEHVGVGLSFKSIGHSGLQSGEGIHKKRHGLGPISAQEQVGVVPSATNNFTVGVHLPNDVLRVNFGVDVVAANAILVVGVEPFADFSDVPQGHGPKVRVALVHRAVAEVGEVGLVEEIIDGMAVFVVHDVGDQRGGVAPPSHVVEVDA